MWKPEPGSNYHIEPVLEVSAFVSRGARAAEVVDEQAVEARAVADFRGSGSTEITVVHDVTGQFKTL